MAGLAEVGGGGGGVAHHLDGARAVGRADAGGYAGGGIDADLEVGAEGVLVAGDHDLDAELLEAFLGGGDADEAAAEAGHEVDGGGGGLFAGEEGAGGEQGEEQGFHGGRVL